jgi:hypothetical protein
MQDDSIAEKDVNVPEYLQIDIPNPMTDDVSKSTIIPYGLNIGLNNTQFSIYNANENKNIIISKGTIIPSIFNADLNTYLPVLPNTLCASSITSTPSPTNYSLYNFLMLKIQEQITLELTFSTVIIQMTFSTGTVQVGGNDLQIYSKNNTFKFIFGNNINTIYGDTVNFKITSESGLFSSLRN